ncbi:EscU/YscU/HrcU family type III secretion system export apparatus switch protein [Comamonas endophytica]|uniref:EscU/YscU/HrcU family type III secretion system export apparatus switch protein n=1 Tax=Comamonas endophytica TaxID=2949090 RepID=A0ABY6GF14_9BURK|nr:MULTISPECIES: EscU/YscU/HrcU family type III secretion system export apparatus switch protein [unclassified Acidovorax]MCD2512734.1 EscU/YscU/HrcU family type III secretion system export apparatus switch protein [Acidovorax sp. D4N7]UYG52915.1 EscU/YscU/HrcU family type III secretion system export apparatus switch protein [Acidovorax sp. 5MLIR]
MDSSQDKNLPATERKLQKTRKDGQGARSRDLSHLAILGMGAVAMLVGAQPLTSYLKLAFIQQFSFNAQTVQTPALMLERLLQMGSWGLVACVLFALATISAAVLSGIMAGGWIFSFTPVMPKFSRLNPLSGFMNLFSKQQLITVVKMVLMTIVLSFIGWKYLAAGLEDMARVISQPSPMALAMVGEWLAGGVALLLLVVFLVALIDVPLQAFLFKSRLKMSHQEVKQEHKESEGNPEIKGKLRQKQREIANRASIQAVPKADFVVMNPTHYAVALRYDEARMDAPQVIAKGTDLLALKIREVANAHDVPVLQSPMLARALYAHAELDQSIPAPLYTAVAQVLAYVYRLKAALRGEGQMPQALDEVPVPPELDPHQRVVPQGSAT